MSNRIRRRGAIYVVVLLASLIVASLAIASLRLAHAYTRDMNREAEAYQVEISADAALEWAIARLNADTAWRSNHTHNVDVPKRVLGDTTISYRLIDTDGNLADNALEPCDIIVTARSRSAVYAWRATLEPIGPPLNCLQYALASGDDVAVNGYSMMCTDGSVASRGRISSQLSGSLTADCFAAEGCFGEIIGSSNSLVGTLELPDSHALFELYTKLGTSIPASLLPMQFGGLRVNGVLLSPAANTISGDLNPAGVYVIDCGGRRISITNSKIVGTLVLRNVGSNSSVAQSMHWEAAVGHYPALLVQGDWAIQMAREPLREVDLGVNLNPPGTPYRGQTDLATTTVYPSCIRGLIYVSGELTCGDSGAKNQLFGVVVAAERVSASGGTYLAYRDIYTQRTPPGFASYAKVRLAAGSIHRVAAP